MKTERYLIASAWISFLVSVAVFGLKYFGYLQTHSSAVLSDALESIVNVIASLAALLVMRAVSEPADDEHPYGHGKLEYFSAAFEGGMIVFASLAIAYGAVIAYLKSEPLHNINVGLIYIGIAGLVNVLLGLHLKTVGKKYQSAALAASSSHVMSDAWTTAGVFAGLVLVMLTGWIWVDCVVALAVAGHLLFSGWKIVRKSIGGLIDEMEPAALMEIATAFQKCRTPGFIDIHKLKVIRSGRFHHIDAHIVVPEYWDVSHAHEIVHELELNIVKNYPYDGEVAFHLDPCKRRHCDHCDMSDCKVRQKDFVAYKAFTTQNLIKGPEDD